ncbi:MAG: patatin-like phospholipase family protein [Beijerinckiaceae bacterium]
MSSPLATRRIGLALGGGGAKGLAHIVALEAFDQAGIRPAAITGTSIGAIIGAAYAAGYSAKAIREHTLKTFRDRADVMARLFRARAGSISEIFSGGFGNAVQMDGEVVLKEFWPPSMPETFSDLRLPFVAVSTDFYGRSERSISSGPLRPAVAASLAIPGFVKPVLINNRLHMDGAAANPLPFDRMPVPCDLIIAVDVVGGPESENAALYPSVLEATLGASQIMQMKIIEGKLEAAAAKVCLVRPRVSGFNALDFFAVRKILQAAEPIRSEIIDLILTDDML